LCCVTKSAVVNHSGFRNTTQFEQGWRL